MGYTTNVALAIPMGIIIYMLTSFFILNIFSVIFIAGNIGVHSSPSYKTNFFIKVSSLILSIIMLFQMIYCVFSAKTLRDLSSFSLNLDFLNLKLTFALEGLTVIFCFLTALLTFICILLV